MDGGSCLEAPERKAGKVELHKHAVDDETEKRIAARDSDDCPTVALALKLDLPVWTQDRTTPMPASRSSRPATCSTHYATLGMTSRSIATHP